jgi:hypothetical protein
MIISKSCKFFLSMCGHGLMPGHGRINNLLGFQKKCVHVMVRLWAYSELTRVENVQEGSRQLLAELHTQYPLDTHTTLLAEITPMAVAAKKSVKEYID